MKLLRDTWLVFGRQVTQSLRSPVWLIMGLFQPVFYLVLFAPLLKHALGTPDTERAYRFFIPGTLVMLAIFATSFVGFGLLGELRAGLIERARVTPLSRLALLLGRSLRDVVGLLAQCAIIVALAVPFGLSASLPGVLVMFLLLGLVGTMLSALSYRIALGTRSEDALSSIVNFVAQPAILLGGILLPMTYGPGWLRGMARVNPVTWTVDAGRAAFAGNLGDSRVWTATMLLAVLAALSVTWAARAFARGVR